METIQKELGDSDEQQVNAMLEQSKQKKWGQKMQEIFEKELKKLRRMNSHSPEYATQQNYLDTLLDLPWNEYSTDNYDIRHAQEILDKAIKMSPRINGGIFLRQWFSLTDHHFR